MTKIKYVTFNYIIKLYILYLIIYINNNTYKAHIFNTSIDIITSEHYILSSKMSTNQSLFPILNMYTEFLACDYQLLQLKSPPTKAHFNMCIDMVTSKQ